jgi:hypothetical protein
MYAIDVHGLDNDGLPAIYNQILECPTLRGHDGEFDLENTWLTTGSGTQKALIQKWKVEGKHPMDWQVLFGERFLLDILGGKKWKWYLCAKCAKHI